MAMQPVTAPLSNGSRGPAVVDLHDGLRRILSSNRLDLPAGERDQLLQAPAKESQQLYADITVKIVEIYQDRRQLPVTGTVDEATEGLNRELADLGGRDDGDGTLEDVLGTL
jgi:hypothetical protein